MLSRLFNYFREEHDNDPSFIRMTRNIIVVILFPIAISAFLVTGVVGEQTRSPFAFATLLILLLVEVTSLLYVVRGRVLMAKLATPISLTVALLVIASTINGLRDISIVALPTVLIIGALLLGKRALWVVTPLAIAGVEYIAFMDLTTPRRITQVTWDDAVIIAAILAASAGVIQALISRLNESLVRAQESEKLHIEENRELIELRTSLEERVAVRTAELDKANRQNERRAKQFSAIAQVARAISNVQSVDTLLPLITQVISQQFDIYHTGIFLLNEAGDFAILQAANSKGGRAMLEREHKLEVGQTSIVGFVTATGQPRIALDVGADAVHFDNPDLPNTHSEIALPLRIGDRIIGALDLQSDKPNAFELDDIQTLNTLADQVSIAIQNARSLQDARSTLQDAQIAYNESLRQSWEIMKPKSMGIGYQISSMTVKPLENPLEDEHVKDAMKNRRTVHITDQGVMAVPIVIRNNVIGVINLKNKGLAGKWTSDDVDIVRAVAERLSIAIETATLLQTTQHRADVERVTTEITSKISSSTRFETILQTAAQELSRALGGSDVLVQIEPVSMDLGMTG